VTKKLPRYQKEKLKKQRHQNDKEEVSKTHIEEPKLPGAENN